MIAAFAAHSTIPEEVSPSISPQNAFLVWQMWPHPEPNWCDAPGMKRTEKLSGVHLLCLMRSQCVKRIEKIQTGLCSPSVPKPNFPGCSSIHTEIYFYLFSLSSSFIWFELFCCCCFLILRAYLPWKSSAIYQIGNPLRTHTAPGEWESCDGAADQTGARARLGSAVSSSRLWSVLVRPCVRAATATFLIWEPGARAGIKTAKLHHDDFQAKLSK